ncbi:hypothetical protein [Pseudomonas aeruginosa]|uniref:hypothetical protein n=1 Tax=Pseudomonas aeruginosa TaxID=287 RepID=UPI002359982C|nr:hypothetical protein KK180_24660 [Pseudomonas aeruginosa]
MSTFAVFGMTRDVALAMAKKEVKSVRKTPLGDEHVPMSEWLAAVERKADTIMTGTKVVQLSQLLDTPDFCHQVHRARAQDPGMPRHADPRQGSALE